MLRRKVSEEGGSAILEFVAFVLVGELLVFGGSMAISERLTRKVELQNLAIVAARAEARDEALQVPSGVVLVQGNCGSRVVCISLSRNGEQARAVSIR